MAGGRSGTNAPGAGSALPSTLRRLSKQEYRNTIKSVFEGAAFSSDVESLVSGVIEDKSFTGFDNTTSLQSIDFLHMDGYRSAAKALARAFTDALVNDPAYAAKWSATCAAGPLDDGCGTNVAAALGRKLYRRPLSEVEASRALGLFQKGSNGADGIARMAEGMLQSPNFLFKIEIGQVDKIAGAKAPLTNYELASRLSFLILEDSPDDALLAAAENGTLSTSEGLRNEMQRLLEDPRAKVVIRRFVEQWFLLTRLNTTYIQYLDKSKYVVTDAMLNSMRQELYKNVDSAVWESKNFFDLYNAKKTKIDALLASQVYHVATPASLDADGFGELNLAGDKNRGGLFGLPAFLTVTAYHDDPSVVLRGKYVRFYALCDDVPPPPAGVVLTDPAAQDENRRMNDPVCSGCHVRMDPIGDGLKRYDSLGRFDAASAFATTKGTVFGVSDAGFDGAYELGALIRTSDMASNCLGEKWIQWATGGVDSSSQSTKDTQSELATAFRASGFQLQALIDAWVQSEAFRTKAME